MTTASTVRRTPKDVNVYRDPHTGGWIVECIALGERIRIGVFGTRAAALSRCDSGSVAAAKAGAP